MEEGGEGRARQCRADADAANAEFGGAGDGEAGMGAHEKIDGFRVDGGDDGADVIGGAGARGVENIGSGFGVGLKPADGLLERLLVPHEETFGARGQQNRGTGSVDGGARGADALDGQRELVKRARGVPRGILDGEAGDSRLHAEANVPRDVLGMMRVAGFEVGVDGEWRGVDQFRYVRERGVERNGPFGVRTPEREGKAGAGGGKGGEAEVLEVESGAGIPGIGNHETAAFVELAKRGAAGGESGKFHGRRRF